MNDTEQGGFLPPMPASINFQQPLPASGGVSDTIASMRWENDPMIINLRIRLGGYRPTVTKNGITQLERENSIKPMVNDLGVDRFIATIQGVINPSVALSNIDDEEANTLIRQILHALIADIAYNSERFEIHPGDRRSVMNVLKSVIFMQLKRPVGGHEARNFRTQTIEQNMSQNMNMPQRGSVLNPFSWRRG